ncbi:MAG: hypothetical protein HQL88_07775 [Magnetococcales bacterium]|nr:hypothetical protein [Magnetococcales bacterium]
MVDVNFFGVADTPALRLLYLRQTAPTPRICPGFHFRLGAPEAEWQVVGTWELDAFLAQREQRTPRQKAIYLQQEPPGMRWPEATPLQSFAALLTPLVMDVEGPVQFVGPPALPWTYGIHVEMREGVGHWFSEQGGVDWEELRTAPPPVKERLCSMVVSRKGFLPGHRARLHFLQTLQNHFHNRIDFFGFGSRPIPDKRAAIDPYLFSIAVENSVHPNYWTEKIADLYLGHAMPIYHGAPNIHHFFDPTSLQTIDIDAPDEAIARIEHLLDHPDAYHAQSVAAARHTLLHEHNTLEWLRRGIHHLRQEA